MEELFDTFDDDGRYRGRVPRSEVHARGLWHRSAQVFLFTPAGALFIQRRAATRDLYANLWDYSVGEHLRPGENYLAGALRGLAEELGVSGVRLQPIGGVRRSEFRIPGPGPGIHDRELQRAFRGIHPGDVVADPAEVACVDTVTAAVLAAWVERSPQDFTPWFLHDLRTLAIL